LYSIALLSLQFVLEELILSPKQNTDSLGVGLQNLNYANGKVNHDSPNPIMIIDEMNNLGPQSFPKHPVPKIHL